MKLMNLDQEHLGIQETEYAVVIKKSIGDLIGTKLPAAGDIIVSPEGDATCLPMPGLEEEDIKTFLLNLCYIKFFSKFLQI